MLSESELYIEIEDYIEHIKLCHKKQGVPNDMIKRAIGRAYDSSVLTSHKKDKTCLGCANDFAHMIGQLIGVIERTGNKPIKLEPKIPKLKPKSNPMPNDMWDDVLDSMPNDIEPLVKVKSLKWGAFKSYCKEQGINVKGKTKVQLLEELGIEG